MTEFQNNEMQRIQATAAIQRNEKGVVLPPPYNMKPDLEKRFSEIYLPEFAHQIGVVSIRKVFEGIVRKLCSDKVADKFCRDFYPKLRRTIKRYRYGLTTYSKVFTATSFISFTENVPFLIYDLLLEAGSFLYQYSFGEIDFEDIKPKEVVELCGKKVKLVMYNVTRDALIRAVLVGITAVFDSSVLLNCGISLELPNEMLFLAMQIGTPMMLEYINSKLKDRAQ
jgi:hypothetical protein